MPPFIAQPQLRFRQAPEADFGGLGDVVSNALRERALSKDFADAAAVDAQGGSAADVMARLAGGRSLEAREAGLTGLLRARALEDRRATDAAAAAESARQFGVTSDIQRERNEIARMAASRTARQPSLLEKEQIKADFKEKKRLETLRSGGRSVLKMVDRLEKKIGAPDSKEAQAFESATGPIEDTMLGRGVGAAASLVPIVGGGARENLRNLGLIKQDAQAINSTLQRKLLKGGGAISDAERENINKILGGISKATDATEARALLQNFRGIVSDIFEIEPSSQPPAQAIPPPPPGFVVNE